MKFELVTFNRNVPDERLLDDLVAAHDKLQSMGKALTFRTYRDVGNYSPSTLNDRFGSWNEALRKAGLVVVETKNIPIQLLFDNLKVVWIAKGKQPVYRDMNGPPSQHRGSTYNARFGSWRKALEEFVAAFAGEEHELLEAACGEKYTSATRSKRDPSLSLRFFVLRRDNFRCAACGRSPATVSGLMLEVDHIVAWSNGGETVAENLQALCFDCNRGKSDS